MKQRRFPSRYVVVLFILPILAGCNIGISKNLESPEITCPTTPASWQSIVPGQSTRADVIEVLGEPVEKKRASSGARVFVYSPVLTISEGGSSYGSEISFRGDGVVDWIDVWVLDIDNKFHTIAQVAQEYGAILDRVYVNSINYGHCVVSGPDQIYVWSHCGVVITAVSEWAVRRSEEENLPVSKADRADGLKLDLTHPVHPQASLQPEPDVHEIVVRQFLFQPTSFASFDEFYADMIPYPDSRFYEMRLVEE